MQFQMTKHAAARGCALGILMGSGLLMSGCTTVDGKVYWPGEDLPKTDNAKQELAAQQAQRETAMTKSQIDGLMQAQAKLVERLDRLEALNRDNAKLRDDLAAMHRELDQVRGERLHAQGRGRPETGGYREGLQDHPRRDPEGQQLEGRQPQGRSDAVHSGMR